MLIDTSVVRAKGMVSLRRLVEELGALPPDQQEIIGEELLAAQKAEWPRFAKRIQRQLDEAKVDGDLHIGLVHVALSMGALTAYALRPTTDSAYKLSTALWHAVGSLHDTARSIEKGIFALNRTLFEEQTPEWEVARAAIVASGKTNTPPVVAPTAPAAATICQVQVRVPADRVGRSRSRLRTACWL
jgi:hypothetical protein